jgi:hypothetical protein
MKLVGGSDNLTLRCKSWSEELEKLAVRLSALSKRATSNAQLSAHLEKK